MSETERREMHAAIAMNALIAAFPQLAARDHTPENGLIRGEEIEHVARRAYEIADAMIAKGGPLE